MVKQIVIALTLCFFFASSAVGSVEEPSGGFDLASQASVWSLDNDLSLENATGRRSLKRLKRGKSALKTLPTEGKPAREIPLIVRVRETSFISHFSYSNVYQQINVYRI
jgi:hypothetical protein